MVNHGVWFFFLINDINGDENFTCRDFTGINHGQPWFIGILIIIYYTGRCW